MGHQKRRRMIYENKIKDYIKFFLNNKFNLLRLNVVRLLFLTLLILTSSYSHLISFGRIPHQHEARVLSRIVIMTTLGLY